LEEVFLSKTLFALYKDKEGKTEFEVVGTESPQEMAGKIKEEGGRFIFVFEADMKYFSM